MSFVDFSAVKTLVSIETVLKWHGATIKPLNKEVSRGSCPVCQSDSKRAFVVTHAKGLWYCFDGCKQGGDSIFLYALLNDVSQKEAAQLMLAKVASPPRKRRR